MSLRTKAVAVLFGALVALCGASAGAATQGDLKGDVTIRPGNQPHATTNRTCPKGETFRQGRCEGANGCPSGETMTNGMCSCPVGNEMIKGRCVNPNACPPPGQFANGQCAATPTCPTGYHLANGRCIAKPR
jgi:hypothetical protein